MSDSTTGPRPIEYWTTENTEAWQREQWAEGSQGTWGEKLTGFVPGPRSRAALTAVIPPATLAEWRRNDPRPPNATYYDGRPIERYQPLPTPRRARARKAA